MSLANYITQRYWEVARAACPDLPSSLGNTDHETILQAIEDARKVPDALRRALHEAEAERDRLAALIEQAPHAQHCGTDHLRPDGAPSRCDCWKSRALHAIAAERDALRVERDRTRVDLAEIADRMWQLNFGIAWVYIGSLGEIARLTAERDRLTGPEMRERITPIVYGAVYGDPENLSRALEACDAIMSLLRGEGR